MLRVGITMRMYKFNKSAAVAAAATMATQRKGPGAPVPPPPPPTESTTKSATPVVGAAVASASAPSSAPKELIIHKFSQLREGEGAAWLARSDSANSMFSRASPCFCGGVH